MVKATLFARQIFTLATFIGIVSFAWPQTVHAQEILTKGTYQQVPAAHAENDIDFSSYHKSWRIGIQAGLSYRIAFNPNDMPPQVDNYLNKLKWGINVSVNVAYFLNEGKFGLGAKYSFFGTKNEDDFHLINDQGVSELVTISDRINIHFAGPAFFFRLNSKENLNAFVFHASMGFMSYQNQATLFQDYTITGYTVGVCASASYDIATSDQSAVGIQFTLYSGALQEYTLDDGTTSQKIVLEEHEYEGLIRADLSIGFRFMK
ncbi:hypothetical protein SAMN04488029_1057 [Reichenbachiella faecimaris]|uniref:Outer membrane protein beta-barrel domain-containing protein n=1 Tax=Reichenbachiella faecimaris TaxID=692418 RepID=A0A1W2G8T7_REIFA|nr:hypothetical protein [Reichenbachiella faecimaris]SMD32706.1 hypothetical protein SAMN04488029_1057 [Reichenbachiella faecimaris]